MALNEEALQALKTELLDELVKEDPSKSQLAERLAEIRSADIGEVLEELIEEDEELSAALTVLDILSTERAANVLGYLPKESQLEVVGELSDSQVLKLLEEMGSDERADLFNRLGEDRREALLRRMAHQEREDLKRLASYEEGTAGAIMTSDYVAIASGMTVSQAMMRVRQTAPDAETVYQLYVLDSDGHLIGTMSLRQLMVARPGALVDDIMIKDVIKIPVDKAQEEVARIVARYD